METLLNINGTRAKYEYGEESAGFVSLLIFQSNFETLSAHEAPVLLNWSCGFLRGDGHLGAAFCV
jgi:hypothetical protein